MINLGIGAVAKIFCTIFLVGIPAINVKGAAFGTVLAYVIAAVLDYRAVKRLTRTKFNLGLTFVKPVVASVIMAAAVFGAYRLAGLILGNALSTIFAVLVGVAVYGVVILAIKGITTEEIRMLPKGNKIAKIVEKIQR